jgi:hypothetical protein
MKFGLFGLAAAAALAVSAGSASAQTVVVPAPYAGPAVVTPAYGPGLTFSGTIVRPGFSVGGVYSTGGVVGVAPAYSPWWYPGGYYARPYYPYHHHHYYPYHHHHYRW